MINLVIALVMLSAAMIDGVNISVKPTIMVFEASAASGTCKSSSSGRNGLPRISKIGVLFARRSARVHIAITVGRTPNHIPTAFLSPFSKNCPTP